MSEGTGTGVGMGVGTGVGSGVGIGVGVGDGMDLIAQSVDGVEGGLATRLGVQGDGEGDQIARLGGRQTMRGVRMGR